MAHKAVLITDSNQQKLGMKYNVEDWEDILTPGYYILADFGEDVETFDVVSEENLWANWLRTDAKLLNEWFEVRKKG